MEKSIDRHESSQIVRVGVLYMIVCVPVGWEVDDIQEFAEDKNPSGTEWGWKVQQGVSVQCAEKPGFVHVRLEV